MYVGKLAIGQQGKTRFFGAFSTADCVIFVAGRKARLPHLPCQLPNLHPKNSAGLSGRQKSAQARKRTKVGWRPPRTMTPPAMIWAVGKRIFPCCPMAFFSACKRASCTPAAYKECAAAGRSPTSMGKGKQRACPCPIDVSQTRAQRSGSRWTKLTAPLCISPPAPPGQRTADGPSARRWTPSGSFPPSRGCPPP